MRIYYVRGGIGAPDSGVAIPYWVTTEVNLAIIIACIPTLRLLVVKVYPRLLDTTLGDSEANIHSYGSSRRERNY
jgi:hypothetical protein